MGVKFANSYGKEIFLMINLFTTVQLITNPKYICVSGEVGAEWKIFFDKIKEGREKMMG